MQSFRIVHNYNLWRILYCILKKASQTSDIKDVKIPRTCVQKMVPVHINNDESNDKYSVCVYKFHKI